MRRSRASRLVRGTVAAGVATFVALLSHVAGGGAMPGWIGVAVPFVLSVTVCTLLAGRRLSATRLALAVAVSQLFFHTLFVLGMFTPAVSLGHAHHGVLAASVDSGAHVGAMLHADAAMWAWHAFAALVTTLALHRGEHAARRLRRLAHELIAWLRRRLPRAVPVASRPRRLSHPGFALVRDRLDDPALAPLRRRGPPPAHVI